MTPSRFYLLLAACHLENHSPCVLTALNTEAPFSSTGSLAWPVIAAVASAFSPCLLLLAQTPYVVPSNPGAQAWLQLGSEVPGGPAGLKKHWSSLSPRFLFAILQLDTFPRLGSCTSTDSGDHKEAPSGGQEQGTWNGSCWRESLKIRPSSNTLHKKKKFFLLTHILADFKIAPQGWWSEMFIP